MYGDQNLPSLCGHKLNNHFPYHIEPPYVSAPGSPNLGFHHIPQFHENALQKEILTYIILMKIENPILTNHNSGLGKDNEGLFVNIDSVKYAWIIKIGKTNNLDRRLIEHKTEYNMVEFKIHY